MKDGRIASSASADMTKDVRRWAIATLQAADGAAGVQIPPVAVPIANAPVHVGHELRGLVVLPPPARSVVRDLGRWLSGPAILILVTVAVIAAFTIFAPARRRLSALQDAAARFGAGDFAARAPEDGEDEIANVARAFNTMAAELVARSEALRTSDRMRRMMLADVSHELKTPLTAMLGYLRNLADARDRRGSSEARAVLRDRGA